MPVVVRPAADDRIERLNQPFLRLGPGFLHDVPGLFQKRFDAFRGRLRQALVPILPDAMTEERESFPNMYDTRLLRSNFETAFPQEFKNHGQDLILQLLLRAAGDDPSGRGNALLRHPPLRTDRAACTAVSSSLSRRLFLPKEPGYLVEQGMRGFLNLFQKGDSPFAGTFELLALLKVCGPLWIERGNAGSRKIPSRSAEQEIGSSPHPMRGRDWSKLRIPRSSWRLF